MNRKFDLSGFIIENGEAAIDAFTESELVKAIPIFGNAARLLRGARSVSDRRLLHKLHRFLTTYESAPNEIKTKVMGELVRGGDEARKMSEKLFAVLESVVESEKSEFLAYVWLSFGEGLIDISQATRLVLAINGACFEDLEAITQPYQDTSEFKARRNEVLTMLMGSGLSEPMQSKGIGPANASLRQGGLPYALTPLCEKFIECIAFGKKMTAV